MKKRETFTYFSEGASSQRIDLVLAMQLPDYSRSYFRRLIDEGFVMLNGVAVETAHKQVKPGDIVEVVFPPAPSYNLTPRPVAFNIVDEQPGFLVINKPAGLLVHPPDHAPDEDSLVHGLLHRYPEFAAFDNEQRPGIVHRLDKDTSGLLLVARSITTHFALSKLFLQRAVKKTYVAVVRGHPPARGTIDFPIGRHPKLRHKMSHVGLEGRDALTHYTVLAYYKDASLVQVHLVTGRTHQIRVHFAAIGHGLLGDALYGISSKQIKRQALHSWRLSFSYRDRNYSYRAPLPDDMKRLVKTLPR